MVGLSSCDVVDEDKTQSGATCKLDLECKRASGAPLCNGEGDMGAPSVAKRERKRERERETGYSCVMLPVLPVILGA